MNKKLTAFFTTLGMTVTGNQAYGIVKGYETNVYVTNLDTQAPIKIHFSFYVTEAQRGMIMVTLKSMKPKIPLLELSAYGLLIGVNDLTVSRLLKRLPALLDAIYGILSANGALGAEYCPVCGERLEGKEQKLCQVDGATIRLDEQCFRSIDRQIEESNRAFAAAPNNYLRGLAGACVGGLAGIACSVVLYLIGFISAISVFVAIYVGAMLYVKFGGKPNKAMIAISSVAPFILTSLSIVLIYFVAAGILAADAGMALKGTEAFSYMMKDEEFSGGFYSDLLFVLIFGVAAVVIEAVAMLKLIKRPSVTDNSQDPTQK